MMPHEDKDRDGGDAGTNQGEPTIVSRPQKTWEDAGTDSSSYLLGGTSAEYTLILDVHLQHWDNPFLSFKLLEYFVTEILAN